MSPCMCIPAVAAAVVSLAAAAAVAVVGAAVAGAKELTAVHMRAQMTTCLDVSSHVRAVQP